VKLALPLLAALAAASAAVPAVAQDRSDTFTAAVQQDDLDLATPAGLATFRGRVKALANRVCGVTPVAPLRDFEAVSACRAELFRSAENQVILALAPGGAGLARGR
jgi:UrcA family protein